LEGDELQVGQVLRLTEMKNEKPATPGNVARQDSRPEPEEKRTEQPRSEEVTARSQTTQPSQPAAQTPPAKPSQPAQTGTQTIRISESMKNSDEVIEAGLAELIEGTEGNRKYLAMHRTAPVGTILKVRNEMNNREVFVRVMGKLPDTAVNDKLIIKLSRSAYDRLGAIDPRFRVELTYYK
jgi:hypothetical protein